MTNDREHFLVLICHPQASIPHFIVLFFFLCVCFIGVAIFKMEGKTPTSRKISAHFIEVRYSLSSGPLEPNLRHLPGMPMSSLVKCLFSCLPIFKTIACFRVTEF